MARYLQITQNVYTDYVTTRLLNDLLTGVVPLTALSKDPPTTSTQDAVTTTNETPPSDMSTQEQQATRDVKANGTPANAAEAKEDTAEIRDDAGATTAPPQPQDDGVTAEGAVQGHDARNSELGPSTEGQTASSDQTGKAEGEHSTNLC